MSLYDWLRTSEFWVAIAIGIGSSLSLIGVISTKDWETLHPYITGFITYVVGRLTSKGIKKLIKPRGGIK